MSNSAQKKFQKKKDREKRVRKELLEKRQALREQAKKDHENALEERRVQKIANRVDGKTIVNRSPEEQKRLLEHNLATLKYLEEQLEQREQPERARGIKQSAEVMFIPNPETNEPLKEPVAAVDRLTEKLRKIKDKN